jgi:dipeptidyl aminopeptidase/acylaminoacyl peptidase
MLYNNLTGAGQARCREALDGARVTGPRKLRDGYGSFSFGVAKQFARRHARGRLFALTGALIIATAVTGATLDLTHESEATVLPDAFAANGRIALLDPNLSLLTSVKPDGSARRVVARCRHVSTPCRIRLFAWSPNGKRLLFFRSDGDQFYVYSLYVVDADGRNLKRLANCGFCGTPVNSGAAWSPHSTSIVYSGKNGLFVVDARRGVTRRLTRCGTSCADLFPAWSPNGSKIAFTRRRSLYTVKPNGSALTKLTSAPYASDPAWSPDGRRLTFDGPNQIYIIDADGSHQTLLLDGASGSGPNVPSWSPDGTRLLFFYTPGTPGAYTAEVWVMKPDGTERSRLYQSGCCVQTWSPPIWSPDGTSIAFSANTAGGVLVMNSDGTHLRTLSPSPSDIAWQPIR